MLYCDCHEYYIVHDIVCMQDLFTASLVSIYLQLSQPHAVYLDSEYETSNGTCGESTRVVC